MWNHKYFQLVYVILISFLILNHIVKHIVSLMWFLTKSYVFKRLKMLILIWGPLVHGDQMWWGPFVHGDQWSWGLFVFGDQMDWAICPLGPNGSGDQVSWGLNVSQPSISMILDLTRFKIMLNKTNSSI